jgi:hypothetical protein
LGWQTSKVWKAGGESDKVHEIFYGTVQLHDALGGQTGVSSDVLEVRAGFTPITDGDLDRSLRNLVGVAAAFQALPDQRLDLRVRPTSRVELHKHRCICRMQVQQPVNSLERGSEVDYSAMRFERDFLGEGNQEGTITRRNDRHDQ